MRCPWCGRWSPDREVGSILSMSEIVGVVASRYNIDRDVVRSHRRHVTAVRARHFAIYLCRELTDHSLSEIGQFFCDRDHSSVHYVVRRMGHAVETDQRIRQEVEYLSERIRNG